MPIKILTRFPVIKLVLKERVACRIYRKYDKPRTPYQRIMESSEISEDKKQELKSIYLSLNPAGLKRQIDKKLDMLYKFYEKKNNSHTLRGTRKVEYPPSQNATAGQRKKKILPNFSGVGKIPVSVR